MNKFSTAFIALLVSLQLSAQNYTEEIKEYQDHMNSEFKDPEHSPLTAEDREHFEALDFFPIDSAYRFVAKFVKNKGKKFEMPTSTSRKAVYRKLGELHFELEGRPYQLSVYQNVELSKQEEYKDYLFIPFKDHTNGIETYGGGRYLDMDKPAKGEEWILDFNKAYNPYCAYADRWSCPIPPEENHLEVEIRAGVKKYHD